MTMLTRILQLLRLAVVYTIDFWTSNFAVARRVLSPRPDIHPGTITIPTRVETPAEMLAISNLISFTPGTLLLDVQPGGRLEIHTLDDRGPVGETITRRLEEPLLRITRRGAHPDTHDD